jgi:predicted HTH transcriptional regulator
MELGVLKSIAAFVNSRAGGSLIIGVADDGGAVGIEVDKFPNEDKMNLHLVNLIKDRLGANHMLYIHPRFDDYGDVRVLVVDCLPGRSPVFVKDGNIERLFVRTGPATVEVSGAKVRISRKEGQRFTARQSMVSRHVGPVLVMQDVCDFLSVLSCGQWCDGYPRARARAH